MRSSDEGDEHLNMKGAACDLLSPWAVHLQEIDSYKTQKAAIQTENKTCSLGSLLPSDIQASSFNHKLLWLPRDPQKPHDTGA